MQNIGRNSATVVWTTDVPTYDYVIYGTRAKKLNSTVTNTSATRTRHAVTLTGLRPGTTYYYQIKTLSNVYPMTSSQTLSFKTTK